MENQIIMSTQTDDGMQFILDLLQNMEADFSTGYIIASTVLSIIVGILAAVFIILAATFSKKNIAFGIVAGIFQIFGALGVQKYVHAFLQMDKVTYITVEGMPEDIADKMEQATTNYLETYLTETLPLLGLALIGSFCMFIAWIMGLVFIALSIKGSGKIFAIIALVLHIGRYAFVLPFNIVAPFMGQPINDMSQLVFDFLYYGATLLPFLLVMIGGIVSGVKAKKQAQLEA